MLNRCTGATGLWMQITFESNWQIKWSLQYTFGYFPFDRRIRFWRRPPFEPPTCATSHLVATAPTSHNSHRAAHSTTNAAYAVHGNSCSCGHAPKFRHHATNDDDVPTDGSNDGHESTDDAANDEHDAGNDARPPHTATTTAGYGKGSMSITQLYIGSAHINDNTK